MYCQFYHLASPPFQLSTGHDFLWEGKNYVKSLEALKYGLDQHSGLSLLTGEAGSGKTTVIRALLNSLDQTVLAALIPDSSLTVQEFYALVAHSFSLPGQVESRDRFHESLLMLLKEAGAENKQVLLVVDEAQQLSPELIEEIDGLLDLQTEDSDRLNICLVVQKNNAQEPGGRIDQAFASHVMVRYLLAPFTLDETSEYIRHRLHAAGADREIFNEEALVAVHRYSQGYPGQINIICDLALFSGFNEKSPEINGAIIQACAEKMQFHEPEDVSGNEDLSATASHANEQRNDDISLDEKKESLPVMKEAALAEDPERSYAMPALAVLAGLILLAGGYVYYMKQVRVILPTEPTAAGPSSPVEKVDPLVTPLPQEKDGSFDAVGYSPPKEDHFVYEQQVDKQEEVGANGVSESIPAGDPVVDEPQAVVQKNRIDDLPSPQELVEIKELQVEESITPEPVARETTGSPESEKTVVADFVSSADDLSVEIAEIIVFPGGSESAPVDVEDVVVQDALPVVKSGPSNVAVTEKEKEQAVVTGTDAVASALSGDHQQETAATPESTESVVSAPMSTVVTERSETLEEIASSEKTSSTSADIKKQAVDSPLPAVKADVEPVAGMDWVDGTNDLTRADNTFPSGQERTISSSTLSTDDEYGAGEVSAPIKKRTPELQKLFEKEAAVAEPSPSPVEKVENKKRPTRVADASAPKEKKSSTADPQPEDVIEWLLNKKRNKNKANRSR